MSLSLNQWKGLSMIVLSLLSVLGAALAVVMKARANQLYVTCGVMFSAGVVLAGGFVHLLFDANEQFIQLDVTNFQWAFAIAGITVVGLASLEIGLDRALGKYMQSDELKIQNTPSTSAATDGASIMEQYENAASPQEEPLLNNNNNNKEEEIVYVDHSHSHTVYVGSDNSVFSSILLTTALSVHSIIEGLGIGSSGDVDEFVSAFIAVAFHKGFTAFALGNGLVSNGYWTERSKRKYFYVSVGTFTFVTLLGIAIGWAISSSSGDTTTMATAVLMAITSGSFVYVAILEILPQETKVIKKEELPIFPPLIFLVAGYCLMAMLAIWA